MTADNRADPQRRGLRRSIDQADCGLLKHHSHLLSSSPYPTFGGRMRMLDPRLRLRQKSFGRARLRPTPRLTRGRSDDAGPSFSGADLKRANQGFIGKIQLLTALSAARRVDHAIWQDILMDTGEVCHRKVRRNLFGRARLRPTPGRARGLICQAAPRCQLLRIAPA
jgi:hypothetical protein